MKATLLAGALGLLLPVIGLASEYNLTVDRVRIDTGDFIKKGNGYNGESPGPVLRFKEGEEVLINVTNNLNEMTSIHSHSGFQEPDGAYGAIVIEPEGRESFRFDRDYVVQLADKHSHSGDRIMRNLKIMPDYYNREQQTVGDFFSDASENGLAATVKDRMAWGDMRMMKAGVEDLQGFTGLINGKGPEQNWTGIFEPGERIRLVMSHV